MAAEDALLDFYILFEQGEMVALVCVCVCVTGDGRPINQNIFLTAGRTIVH